MSETMPSPSEWVQFYSRNLATPHGGHANSPTTAFGDRVSDSIVVTTTATTVTSPTTSLALMGSSSSTTHLTPEGRVSKPIRRRSRASRRTPTTVLNTSTTNFRAMVQQFTGGPTAPFAASNSPASMLNYHFGLGDPRQHHANPNSGGVMQLPSSSGFHLQQQQQQIQQQQQHLIFSLNTDNNNNSNDMPLGDHVFFQRHGGNPRGRPANMVVEGSSASSPDRFVMEGISSHVPNPDRPGENRNNSSFMF
ncbi:VQ protein [Dillenia turbinata]|uniref:VQ protein n=1 Tax=Dillenia turbinata TaxID=194707 RepID=A0AAN8UUV4_9MAGN